MVYPMGTTTYAAAAAPTITMATAAAPTTTTVAAPTYATYAAPATYAAAPTTYAATPTVVETVAAPAVTYAAPTAYAAAPMATYATPTVAAPSFVPMPAVMPAMVPAAAMPAMPVKLTEGLPDPTQIATQKAAYAQALDKQLATALATVEEETKIEKQMVGFTAQKQIALFDMQVDEKLTESLAVCDEQATFAMLELKKALVERQLQLNNQASGLIMDYNMKAAQSDMAQKQYAFQVQYMKAEADLMQQYQAAAMKGATGTAYTAPAGAVA